MTLSLILPIAALNQLSFSGTRVTISLFALDQGASQFTVGAIIALFPTRVFLINAFAMTEGGVFVRKLGVPGSDSVRK